MSTPNPPTPRAIVSSFLSTGTPHTPSFRISIFKRSGQVRVYQNLWAACSGGIEASDATPLAAALREIAEETSLSASSLTLLSAGEAYEVFDAEVQAAWTIYPFLWRLKTEGRGEGGRSGGEVMEGEVEAQERVRLDWEHTEVRFVRVEEVEGYETVAHLGRSLRRVLDGLEMGRGWEG